MPDAAPRRPPSSGWSIYVCRIFGIPFRIHLTFLLLLAWVAFRAQTNALDAVLFVLAIFVCVLLHELGHAVVARKFKIQTRDITLYPIGGIAMLESRPRPAAEFWIAIAGPAVNFAIAIALLPFALSQLSAIEGLDKSPDVPFAGALFLANVTLALFNLIPAFPMDGGRVLRSLLALSLSDVRATAIAAGVGQLCALGMLCFGLAYSYPLLMLIAFMVWVGAVQESGSVRTRSVLHGHTVADAMQVKFRTIESGASMDSAASILLEGGQHEFPVVAGAEVIGVLGRADIARGLRSDGSSGYVAGHMRRAFLRAAPEEALETAVSRLGEGDPGPLLVMRGDELIGMLTRDNVGEFIMLEHARSRAKPGANGR